MNPEDMLTKKIGLIGGLSYPSTITYYELINKLINQRLGRAHSARIVLESLDFQPMAEWLTLQHDAAASSALVAAAHRLEYAGADFVAMCCNTVHKYAKQVASSIDVPLINICSCTAQEAARRGSKTVALLGSAYSMEEDFYRHEFRRHGIEVLIPDAEDRRFMQQAIESELSVGDISTQTRHRFISDCTHTFFPRGRYARVGLHRNPAGDSPAGYRFSNHRPASVSG